MLAHGDGGLSGQAINKKLFSFEERWLKGDSYALFMAIMFCAAFEITIPDWLRSALLASSKEIAGGRIGDFNEFFGWDVMPKSMRDPRSRKAKVKTDKFTGPVLMELFAHHASGGSLNNADGFVKVEENLAPLGVRLRKIREIYAENPEVAASIEALRPDDEGHGMGYVEFSKDFVDEMIDAARDRRRNSKKSS